MSMAYVGVVMSVISAAMTATSAIMQGQAQKEQADANAKAQRQMAISKENEAAQISADQKLKARKIAATGMAQAGAGGVDPVTGSPLTLDAQTIQFGELDSLRIINNAQRTAWGYQAQANIDEWGGNQAQTAGYMKAGGAILGGLSSAYFGASAGSGGGGNSFNIQSTQTAYGNYHL